MKLTGRLLLRVFIAVILLAGLTAWLLPRLKRAGFSLTNEGVSQPGRDQRVIDWIAHPQDHPGWAIQAKARCAGAPFMLPTSGYIGYLWDDGFQPGHAHQGIDIFGGADPGKIPVYAAYDGFLTRESGWKSSVIVRIPSDPLEPSRQIWTYYTHMADPQGGSLIDAAFSPGSSEVFVKAGTLLGYQGDFSGTPGAPVGVHLHFSIVKDDGQGHFTNELEIENTLDPTPYLGIEVNAGNHPPDIPLCSDQTAGGKRP